MTVLLLTILLWGSAAAELPWYGHYDTAVQLIDAGQPAAARDHLLAALEGRAEPGRMVRTYGLRYVDYLPYLYLAVASHMLGEVDMARSYLVEAEARGVAATTEVGGALLPAYRLLLAGGRDEAVTETPDGTTEDGGAAAAEEGGASGGAGGPPAYRVYAQRPPTLPDDEAERVRREIGARCGLDSTARDSRLPWYFHYELGLTFVRLGDYQRALDELVAAAEQRPDSQHGARMYGMWFTDYLPYFAIARAHAEMGNWRCVLSALERSEEMGEVGEEDDDFAAFRALMVDAQRHQP